MSDKLDTFVSFELRYDGEQYHMRQLIRENNATKLSDEDFHNWYVKNFITGLLSILNLSPWRKVEDQPPPNDGSWFLWRRPVGQEWHRALLWWDDIEKVWTDGAGWHFKEFKSGDEWAPIPK